MRIGTRIYLSEIERPVGCRLGCCGVLRNSCVVDAVGRLCPLSGEISLPFRTAANGSGSYCRRNRARYQFDLTYNLCMKLVALLTILLSCAVALAQQALDIEAEPHYHLLLGNDQVRIFLLRLSTDASAVVHFRHSLLTVALQDGELIIWYEGKSPIQHFQVHKGGTTFVCLTQDQHTKGVSGGFRKDRPGNYRNIRIEFLDPPWTGHRWGMEPSVQPRCSWEGRRAERFVAAGRRIPCS
jgi:hypothetical protein